MICLISGMVCESRIQKTRDGKETPVTFLFSGGETVKINNVYLDKDKEGSYVDIMVELKLAEFDGRKYLRINAIGDV